MKCPKCGFNSFEHYDKCKKCSYDLVGYKQIFNISSLVLPLEAKNKMAAEYQPAEVVTNQVSDTTETHDDIFSFVLPETPDNAPIHHNDDPFSFDEPVPIEEQPGSTKSEDDGFADLLELTSQNEESPFADIKMESDPSLISSKKETTSPVPGEFDLESFSWDETVDAAPAVENRDTDNDFDSLFGDTKGTSKK